LGALLGRSIGELLELPQRELGDWALYWKLEPWGAWRDNMHAGIVAASVLQPHLKEGAKIKPEDFMLVDRDVLRRKSISQFAAQLNSASQRKPAARRKVPTK